MKSLLLLLILLVPPALVNAQFTFTASDYEVTITKYTGPGGAVTIPSTITGLPVASIGTSAFSGNAALTKVVIPESVTGIANLAFSRCPNLKGIYFLGSPPSISIPPSITYIDIEAFGSSPSLTSLLFMGDPPILGPKVFDGTENVTLYYLPGFMGWDSFDGQGQPVVLWSPQLQSPSPTARPISAIRRGRIIPAVSTASARRNLLLLARGTLRQAGIREGEFTGAL